MPSMLDQLITAPTIAPPKIIVYGEPGVGKTTLAAQADAILIDCENGAGSIPNLKRTPYLASWPEIRNWLIEFARNGSTQTKVLAIDTLDWLVQRIIEHVVIDLDGDTSITNTLAKSHGGYMKGREVVQNIVYRELLPMLNQINSHGIALLLLAHAKNEKSTTPEGFDRQCAVPDIQEWIRKPFTEWADAVLYARPDRELMTTCSSTVFAKNRYQFPAALPLSWPAITGALTQPTPQSNNPSNPQSSPQPQTQTENITNGAA